ncbi:Caspase family protein [Candidatus Magnetomoraceae bacterium gMMP-13]
MKSKSIYFVLIALFVMAIYGCGTTGAKKELMKLNPKGEKNEYIKIIINDEKIKNAKHGSDLVKKIKEVFEHSFKNVSVHTGYENPKGEELVIIPKQFSLIIEKPKDSKDGDTISVKIANVYSSLLVSYDKNTKHYNINGSGTYELTFSEILLLIPSHLATLGTLGWAHDALWKKTAANRALKSAAIDLHNKVVSSPEFIAFAESAKMLSTASANLQITPKFTDTTSLFPNNTIDAGENSTINLTLTNNGKGTAFDVKLVTQSNYQNIEFPQNISVGDIQPGESKKVKVNLKADLNLQSGTASFLIQAKEKRGYDSKKYKLNVSAAQLEKPNIIITNYRINDSSAGLAQGNGNGIPENGETIEIIPFMKNTGVGRAIKVRLALASDDSQIKIKRKSATIPQILPGQTITGKLAFSVPRTFSGKEIKINLTASDIRGASQASKLFAISTETNQPVLAYTYKILDGNKNNFLENGKEGEIEIILSNKGKMDARDVNLDLFSNDFLLLKKYADISRISANSTYVPLRFAFKVPRTLEKDSINLRVKFSQKDFAGLTDQINIPVRLVMPDFKITHQILDSNNNGIIEQGESLDLIVRVQNIGNLDAEDVVLNLRLKEQGKIKQGVILNGSSSIKIGRIPAGKISEAQIFPIHVQRRAETGSLPINFAISQKDFSAKALGLALSIKQEQAEVISVAGKKMPQRPFAVIPASSTPPLIAIASPKDRRRVASKTEILAGTVVDDRGVASIEIILNGHRLDNFRAVSVVASTNPKDRDFRLELPLKTGKNEITVTAIDIENLSSSKTITVYRESEKGEIWAAVIGVNKYQCAGINSLKYAKNDAEAFAGYLRTNMGLDSNHIFELYDERASLKNMTSLLGSKLRRKATRPEDTVFIFFAGHGAPEKDSLSRDGDGLTKYILPCDVDVDDLYSTALPMDRVAEIFSRIRAERIIFIADSCYSGGSGGRTIFAPGKRATISDAFLERIAKSGKGRIILTSSNANEVSQESDKLQHGIFTYYLLEALRGEADINGDSLIDVGEAYRYLNKWVPDATKDKQHPIKKQTDNEGLVIIGRIK